MIWENSETGNRPSPLWVITMNKSLGPPSINTMNGIPGIATQNTFGSIITELQDTFQLYIFGDKSGDGKMTSGCRFVTEHQFDC